MAAIVNNRIEGTRITVWDVTHYLEEGAWTHEQIAEILKLTLDDVRAAVAYIGENADEVWKVHREIDERHARGNPPHLEAIAREGHAKILAWLTEHDTKLPCEVNGEGNHR